LPYIDIEGDIPSHLTGFDAYQVYNNLDSCITSQLLPELLSQLNQHTATTYNREMRVLALCLEMSSKGFPVDPMALASLIYDLEKAADRSLQLLHRFCDAVGFRHVNPRSPKDVPELFYEHLRIPEIWDFDRKTNTRKLAADVKALEKIKTQYPSAAPFVLAIGAYREATKMASVFRRGLEPKTGTLRCNSSGHYCPGRLRNP
jgi:DNA polymerase I-like protein with 3'-5' exonuclease and polymerase domains